MLKEGSVARFSWVRFSRICSLSAGSSELISVIRPRCRRERMRSLRPSSWPGGRAEATTTWRPPSSSELMMCSNSCSVFSPRMNSRSSISRMSIWRNFSLKAMPSCALMAFDELIAEALGRQVQHLRLRRAPLHLPGDGMLQMRLAEADRGVEVERIEAAVICQHRLGHLGGGGMRHAIGGTDHEALEGIARVQRRALEAVDVRAPHHHARTGADGDAPHLGRCPLRRLRQAMRGVA
jgi:hypothetical protein